MGVEMATEAPTGIAGTGVTAFMQIESEDAPAPPPETWNAYQEKGEDHTGVVEMLNMLMADLDKELQETEVDEKHDQRVYEEFMAESAKKRAENTKSVASKEA